MSVEDQMQAALQTLLVEAADLLEDFEQGLLALEQGGDADEVVNSIFRAVHTIKGSAGLFGLDPVVAFTHGVETELDRVRDGDVPVSPGLISALLPCKDHLVRLMEAVGAGDDGAALADAGEVLLAGLVGVTSADAAPDDPAPAAGRLHLSLRFGPDCLRAGMDPLSFLNYLAVLGTVVAVTPVVDLLPDAEDLDAETCYLAFEVTLETDSDVDTVADVFEFVREESDIRVLGPGCSAEEVADLVASYGALGGQVAAALALSGLGAGRPAAEAGEDAAAQAPAGADGADGADDVAGAARGSGDRGDSGAPAAAPVRVEISGEARMIRVDASRLDRLIDTVGELVIAGAGAGLSALVNGDESVRLAVDEVTRLIEGARDDALRLRMVPIGTTFGRFQRVVRDVSASLGKEVSLVVSGGDTEVDKALVEQIGDPLMHLVRNALDHGIESPEERLAHGKPARGTLQLRAAHDSGSILVEIEDDGGGIDPERVLAKAVERGLVEPGTRLSDQETYALVFEPGFSTAGEVTSLSGRGVGMDVVKRNVAALRGTIDLDSTPGHGTLVRIRLPLTLAIIDGFMVSVGSTTFIIPLDRVLECVELPELSKQRDYLDLRGEVLPLIRLRSLLAVGGEPPRRESVVVVEDAGVRAGLVVDGLMGEFQTVIKPLGPMFSRVQGIGGSTILGNGEVALIVDVPMLVAHAAAEATRLVGTR